MLESSTISTDLAGVAIFAVGRYWGMLFFFLVEVMDVCKHYADIRSSLA